MADEPVPIPPESLPDPVPESPPAETVPLQPAPEIPPAEVVVEALPSPPPPEPAPETSAPPSPPSPSAPAVPRSELGSTTGAAASAPILAYRSAALQKKQSNKRAKLDKIVALAREKHSIKNDDVEKLLHVSDATATRYLSQLVAEGRLRRVGKTVGSTYEPI